MNQIEANKVALHLGDAEGDRKLTPAERNLLNQALTVLNHKNMIAYKVIKPGTNSNTIVEELNAVVLLGTFELFTGIQEADLYTSVNTANHLVKKGTTAPINSTYVGTFYLDFGSSSKPGSDKPGIVISDAVKRLSTAGIISILTDADHVSLFGDESRLELQQILQLNINDDLIDEVEVLTVLSGE